jgi:hypothetical protein
MMINFGSFRAEPPKPRVAPPMRSFFGFIQDQQKWSVIRLNIVEIGYSGVTFKYKDQLVWLSSERVLFKLMFHKYCSREILEQLRPGSWIEVEMRSSFHFTRVFGKDMKEPYIIRSRTPHRKTIMNTGVDI